MAKTSLTGLTPGDANPKKKANQKRQQLAKGASTGDVSQVNLQFEQPKIQQFKWYGDTYSRPTEANLVPTLDLPSVQGFYDDTRIAKQNELTERKINNIAKRSKITETYESLIDSLILI